jgi:hypothetical protein
MNPARRYMKAFYMLISLFMVLNRLTFKVAGEFLGIDFLVESPELEASVSIGLLFLSFGCLYYDFKERGTLKTTKKEPLLDEKGNDKQEINNFGKVNKQINIDKNNGNIRM